MSPSKTYRKIDIEGPMPHTRPIHLSSYNVYDVLIHAGFMGGVCACVCFRPCLFLYNFRVYFWPCLFFVSISVKNRRVRVYFRVRVYLSCLFLFLRVYFQKTDASCLFSVSIFQRYRKRRGNRRSARVSIFQNRRKYQQKKHLKIDACLFVFTVY